MLKMISFVVSIVCAAFVVPVYIGMQVTLHDCGLSIPLPPGVAFTCSQDHGGAAFVLSSLIGTALALWAWNRSERFF